ncbi:Uncharacterised protein [Mycobacteroides abscessus]|nr:Uncharacterised protein [Mycobacteroides abscessus]
MVRDLVDDGHRHLLDHVLARLADGERRVPEDRDAVGQRARRPHVVALRERHPLVEPEQLGVVVGRVVLDEHHDVVHLRRQLLGDEVQPVAHGVLEVGPRHLHHPPILPRAGGASDEEPPAAPLYTGRRS